ncbi:hypothetical protein CHS0354_023407 [Potamilus streckersoni]|uniref:Uncharacterized protein n=1 Tax=Potamilus streckersoni TaxID=2493646 RepID=A0AAE0RY85_9BIVA|nr:hypothetical protein CHS0354_023407 [Potamilus streckersoni]
MKAEHKEMKESGKVELPNVDSLHVEFMPLDLTSFASTMSFIQKFKATYSQLHVLICNAGVALPPFEKSHDGYETMLQVNYLSHFLLTAHLLPVMKLSGKDCRIVNVSSGAHSFSKFDLDTINYSGDPQKFGRMDYYGRSKLYQVMQMYTLNRRLKNSNVTISCVHPGMVATEIGRYSQDIPFSKMFFGACRLLGFIKEPDDGAKTIINTAVNPDLIGIGCVYYVDCKPTNTSAASKNEAAQAALWEYTLKELKSYLPEDIVYCLEGADPDS